MTRPTSLVHGSRRFGFALCHWHGSMGDPVYAVGSCFIGGHSVSPETARAAAKSLRHSADFLRTEKRTAFNPMMLALRLERMARHARN